jgi:hypothetical protein
MLAALMMGQHFSTVRRVVAEVCKPLLHRRIRISTTAALSLAMTFIKPVLSRIALRKI